MVALDVCYKHICIFVCRLQLDCNTLSVFASGAVYEISFCSYVQALLVAAKGYS